eukprot:gene62475-85449_t
MAALDAGVAGFTHLFNAMSQMTGREPGAVGAALAHATAAAGIIVDGIHVHAANVALALRIMGPERLFLVSDAMPTAGSDLTSFTLGGRLVRLHNGRLTNEDGTLAGAHLTMAEAVRNLVAAGAPWEDALQMATATPAATTMRDPSPSPSLRTREANLTPLGSMCGRPDVSSTPAGTSRRKNA